MILPIIIVLIFVGVAWVARRDRDWEPLYMVPILGLAVSFFVTIICWSDQVLNIEYVTSKKHSIELNKERVNAISIEIKRTLTEIATQYERDVFETMTPDRIALFASAYPQLQANASLMKYCDLIVSLSGEIQTMQTEVFETEAQIRATRRNVFIPFNFLFPVE